MPRSFTLPALFLLFAASAAPVSATERVLLVPPGAAQAGAPAARSAAPMQSAAPAVGKEIVPGSLTKLRATADKDGKVRVIVGYRVPFAPEGRLSAAERAQQRQEIASAGASLRRAFAASGGSASSVQTFSSVPFAAMTVNRDQLGQMLNDPNVISVSEDAPVQPQLTYSVPLTGAPQAWTAGARGKGQVIAVIDGVTQTNHPFLRDPVTGESKVIYEAKVMSGTCRPQQKNCSEIMEGPGTAAFPPASGSKGYHGTAVAGIIVGERPATASIKLTQNDRNAFWPAFPAEGSKTGAKLTGVAPDAKLMVLRAYYTSDFIMALQKVYELRSRYNIAAVSTSLGVWNAKPGPCDDTHLGFAAIVGNLRAAGIATVAAAGNNKGASSNTGSTDTIMAPACLSTAVSVGAVFTGTKTGSPQAGTERSYGAWQCSTRQIIQTDKVACFSDSAPELTLLAPSFPIETSAADGTYTLTFGGTSAATPHVGGAFAVLRSAVPTATVDEIIGALRATGMPIRDDRTGLVTPRIDIPAALAALKAGLQPAVAYTRTGDGSGKVTFSPFGSRALCSANCTNVFASGTTITLTAKPDPDMTFQGWASPGGECQGTSPTCTLTVSKLVTAVSAKFGRASSPTASYTLSYARSGTGNGMVSVTANGLPVACNASTCSTSQPRGTTVTLVAKADNGSLFTGWSGACTGTTTTCSLALTSNASVTASFQPQASNSVSLSVMKLGTGTIGAAINGQQVSCSSTVCNVTGRPGAAVTLTATPGIGAAFAGWSGTCKSSTTTCYLTLKAGGVALATFRAVQGKLASTR